MRGRQVEQSGYSGHKGAGVQVRGINCPRKCGKEVKKKVQAGQSGWRKVSGVMCDKRVTAKVKGKV